MGKASPQLSKCTHVLLASLPRGKKKKKKCSGNFFPQVLACNPTSAESLLSLTCLYVLSTGLGPLLMDTSDASGGCSPQ